MEQNLSRFASDACPCRKLHCTGRFKHCTAWHGHHAEQAPCAKYGTRFPWNRQLLTHLLASCPCKQTARDTSAIAAVKYQ